MEGRELYAVPVDLADVEVFADFGDFGAWDVVCRAPDALGGRVLDGCQVRCVELEMGMCSRGLIMCPSVRGR